MMGRKTPRKTTGARTFFKREEECVLREKGGGDRGDSFEMEGRLAAQLVVSNGYKKTVRPASPKNTRGKKRGVPLWKTWEGYIETKVPTVGAAHAGSRTTVRVTLV